MTRTLALMLLLLGGVLSADAEIPLRVVALSGQPAPGGGFFDRFTIEAQPVVAAVNAGGDVAYFATLARAQPAEALFVAAGARAVRLAADGAPVPGGGTLSGFGRHPVPAMNAAGAVAFAAAVRGGSAVEGIFVAVRGRIATVALAGAAAPGVVGGTLAALDAPAINERGDIAFLATVRKARETVEAVYLRAGATMRKLVAQGDAAVEGGSFAAFGPPALARRGEVAFAAVIEGRAAPGGVFIADGRRVSLQAAAGGPTPVGGIFARFSERVAINASGAIAFSATLKDAATPAAIFIVDAAGARKVVAVGDAAPGGGVFSNFGPWPTLSDAGAVAFVASVDGNGSPIGVFVAGVDGLFRVAAVGDRLPSRGTLASFGQYPVATIGPAGHVAFASAPTATGQGEEGIFLAPCVSSCRTAGTR